MPIYVETFRCTVSPADCDHAQTDFHRELKAGDVIALESTIVKLENKSGTFHHRLRNVATDEVAMSTEFKCVLLDLETRKAAVIPEDIRKTAVKNFECVVVASGSSPSV